MPSANLVDSTRRYLNSCNIYVNERWLTGCLDFFLESSTDSDISTIQRNVKEQYYLNDLENICDGCLPANLKSIKEIILPNKYILQINSIIDIGKPAYQQFMELNKVDLGDIEATKTYEEKIPACRMLKLNMTDGAHDVVGIEYRTITRLNVNITPGFKILIKGPVKCRNGTLLLEEKNCELLDGEVDDLIASNSQLMVLERQLSKFDSDKVKSIIASSITQSDSEMASDVTPESVPSTFQQNSPRMTSSNSNVQSTFGLASDFSRPGPSGLFSERPVSENIVIDDEEDIVLDPQELDKIEATYTDILNRSNDIEMPPEKNKKTDRSDEFPDDDEEFIDDHFNIIDEMDVFDERDKDFVDIRYINTIKEKAFKNFIVKARIYNILTKLTVTKESWHLNCNLSDDTDNIDVSFSNEVLQRVVGYTPQQMYQIRKQMKTQPELKEKATLIILEAREKLQNLNCKMKIEFKSDTDMPTVTELIDYNY